MLSHSFTSYNYYYKLRQICDVKRLLIPTQRYILVKIFCKTAGQDKMVVNSTARVFIKHEQKKLAVLRTYWLST